MRVALAQMNTTASDSEALYAAMLDYAQRAQEQGADLIIYPAPVLLSLAPLSPMSNDAREAQVIRLLERLAEAITLDALVPFRIGSEDGYTRTMLLLRDGYISQINAPQVDSFTYEGIAFSLVDIKDDFELLDKEDKGQVILYLPLESFDVNNKMTTFAPAAAEGCFSDFVDETSWLIALNPFGAHNGYVYCGGSFVMSPAGDLVACASSHAEELICADIDLAGASTLERPDSDVQTPWDARENITGPVSAVRRTPDPYDRNRMLWDACCIAVHDQIVRTNCEGAMVLLDGTLATSVVAALATDAVGPTRVCALICADHDALLDARQLAKSLRIREVDELRAGNLARALDALGGDVDAAFVTKNLITTRFVARAQQAHLLPLTCVDKTELALSLETPFGSEALFAPFGDVYRSDVMNLATWRNTLSPLFSDAVLGRICPVEGLVKQDETLTKELAIQFVDADLYAYFEGKAAIKGTLFTEKSKEYIACLVGRIVGAQDFRRFGPRYPIMSSCPLMSPAVNASIIQAEGLIDHEASKTVEAFRRNLIQDITSAIGRAGMNAGRGSGLGGANLGLLGDIDLSKLEGVNLGALGDIDLGDLEGMPILGISTNLEELGISPEDIEKNLKEMMGFIEELSQGKRMSASSGDAPHDKGGVWSMGMFSDN